MLTRLLVRNFKTIAEADFELGSTVVLVGPNNSGKTSALQALALWQSGLRQWRERRTGSQARERSGVTLNRTGLTHTPVPDARALWRDLKVSAPSNGGRNGSPKVFIDVMVEGQTDDGPWTCGLEFYHANPESIYCRPLRLSDAEAGERMPVPEAAMDMRVAYLPPMSGLVAEEAELKSGRIDVLIGEGQTAQVLRNLCLTVQQDRPQAWRRVQQVLRRMFGVELHDPERNVERGSIRLAYHDVGRPQVSLDISSAGRGLQQTLLLLAHVAGNPGAVLLFDEPDAHLEILRQREIYDVIVAEAAAAGSQVIAASHSEIILDTAAQRDVVIGFLGVPYRVNGGIAQLRKALRDIPFDHYLQARQKGAVLYLEGATDLRLLLAFAEHLQHPAAALLRDAFAHFVANQPNRAAEHYFGLREACPELRSFALFDRLERSLPDGFALPVHCWARREFENYLASADTLMGFAQDGAQDLFGRERRDRMEQAIGRVAAAFRTLGRDLWSGDAKASEDVLPPIFENYYALQGVHNVMAKADYHQLVAYMTREQVDPEIGVVLDRIAECLTVP